MGESCKYPGCHPPNYHYHCPRHGFGEGGAMKGAGSCSLLHDGEKALEARVRELEAELELEHRKDHAYASYMAGYEDGARDVLVLRKRMTDDERDAFIHEWFKRREWAEDCTCNEDGLDSGCWYHLTPHEKSEERARSLIRLFNDLREVQLEGEVVSLREQVRELRDIARDVAIHDCESWDCDHLYSGEPTPNLDKVCIPTRARNALAKPEGVQR